MNLLKKLLGIKDKPKKENNAESKPFKISECPINKSPMTENIGSNVITIGAKPGKFKANTDNKTPIKRIENNFGYDSAIIHSNLFNYEVLNEGIVHHNHNDDSFNYGGGGSGFDGSGASSSYNDNSSSYSSSNDSSSTSSDSSYSSDSSSCDSSSSD